MTKKEFIEKLEAELKDETYSTVTQVMTRKHSRNSCEC